MVPSPVSLGVKCNALLGQVKRKSKNVAGEGNSMNPPRMFWEFCDEREGIVDLGLFQSWLWGPPLYVHLFPCGPFCCAF